MAQSKNILEIFQNLGSDGTLNAEDKSKKLPKIDKNLLNDILKDLSKPDQEKKIKNKIVGQIFTHALVGNKKLDLSTKITKPKVPLLHLTSLDTHQETATKTEIYKKPDFTNTAFTPDPKLAIPKKVIDQCVRTSDWRKCTKVSYPSSPLKQSKITL